MPIKVEVFHTPGCRRCAQVREGLKSVVLTFGADRVTWRDIDVLEEMAYAVELGVLTPPSIAIDDELVFPALPSPERLREELITRVGSLR